MHARFNNASPSMRSQRVVSFLTSTRGTLPSPLPLHPRPFYSLCTLVVSWRIGVLLFSAKYARNVSRHFRRIHTEVSLSLSTGSARLFQFLDFPSHPLAPSISPFPLYSVAHSRFPPLYSKFLSSTWRKTSKSRGGRKRGRVDG